MLFKMALVGTDDKFFLSPNMKLKVQCFALTAKCVCVCVNIYQRI